MPCARTSLPRPQHRRHGICCLGPYELLRSSGRRSGASSTHAFFVVCYSKSQKPCVAALSHFLSLFSPAVVCILSRCDRECRSCEPDLPRGRSQPPRRNLSIAFCNVRALEIFPAKRPNAHRVNTLPPPPLSLDCSYASIVAGLGLCDIPVYIAEGGLPVLQQELAMVFAYTWATLNMANYPP
jgi:hypothetical protein